ncbi:type IV pilus modification PilV family protein [Phorcysia thermohydrogeniphila]|uniref:Prepilin-type N-terminal cleavage/methylation domain-containing protein n=1 Tax=Phorcysia thermohydrogeniphila TaxID=936138 RepID=A0A4V2PDW4_9BACT|nr:type II secretion system protein [Phorcysia thermohydrogeniphila]TCK06656.1 prepilin-type N-terminal cleavage/methylation domain-containing protein [Phorcysia thermohydrogeniphila]
MRKGFTLLEVLVATAILAITLLGLLGAIVVSQKENLSSLKREEATRLLKEELDSFLAKNYDDVTLPNCPPSDTNRENFLKTTCSNNLDSGTDIRVRIARNINLEFAVSSCMTEDTTLNIKTVYVDVCWKRAGGKEHLIGSMVVRKE